MDDGPARWCLHARGPAMTGDIVFPFRFHPFFRLPAALAGVRPDTASVVVSGAQLLVRFGPWSVQTRLSNVAAASVTTSYAWPKVIGPPHLSLADRGLTFATNPDAGVCIRLHRPVGGLEPFHLIRHPSLTVTVWDTAALAELLDRPSHDDQRTHTPLGDATVDDLLEEAVDELRSLPAAQLRRRAADRGIARVSRLSKAQLVDALRAVEAPS